MTDINNNTAGKCENKCEFVFNYSATRLVAQNNGDYISYRANIQNTPPVIYNSEQYNVKEMRLYQPSLHSFGGEKPIAEVVIEHANINGKGNLYVCIPVKETSEQDTTLDKLITPVLKLAPTKGGNAGEIALPFFSFSEFVPIKPFYSYKGIMPGTNMEQQDFIVFGKEETIPISKLGYRSLLKIIQKNNYNTLGSVEGFTSSKRDTKIYFNKEGAKKSIGNGNDEIYIDCQPTGQSGEVLVDVPVSDSSITFSEESVKSLLNNPFVKGLGGLLIGIFIMIILMKLVTFTVSSLNSSPPSSSGASNGIQNIS